MKPLMLDKINDHYEGDRDAILQKVGSSHAQFRTPVHEEILASGDSKGINFYSKQFNS